MSEASKIEALEVKMTQMTLEQNSLSGFLKSLNVTLEKISGQLEDFNVFKIEQTVYHQSNQEFRGIMNAKLDKIDNFLRLLVYIQRPILNLTSYYR